MLSFMFWIMSYSQQWVRTVYLHWITFFNANNNFYARLWDVILFHNEVTGSITDIDVTVPAAPLITVSPNEITDQFPALTAGDELVVCPVPSQKDRDSPEGAVSGTWEYSNWAQIIEETIGYTGTEMVNQTWFDVTSKGQ